MNNDIKQYLTKSGKKRFKFSIYLGKDALTGKSVMVRKGFQELTGSPRNLFRISVKNY